MLFPVLVFVGLLVLACGRSKPRIGSWDLRDAALQAGLGTAVVAMVVAEVLSLLGRFDPGGLQLAWGGVALLVVVAANRLGRAGIAHLESVQLPRPRDEPLQFLLLLVVAGVGITALVSPEGTGDGLVYHMPRAFHYLQQGSLDPYPTSDSNEVFYPPGSEIAVAELVGLRDSDLGVGLVQWCGYVGCALASSAIARDLGANPAGQFLAAVLASTLPGGVGYASNVKQEWSLACWLACLALSLLARRKSPDPEPRDDLSAGVALGLALLWKPLALFYAPPFLVLAAGFELGARGRLRATSWLRVASVAILLVLPHGLRVLRATGVVLWKAPDRVWTRNEKHDPGSWFSVLLRNVALHGPPQPTALRSAVEAGVETLHQVLGLDSRDPATTYYRLPFRIEPDPWHEYAGAFPFHAVLGALALVLALGLGSRDEQAHGLAVVLGGGLLCLGLKWTPWHGRYHIPFFVLAAPLVGSRLGRFAPACALAWPLVLLALQPAFRHSTRPLLGRFSVLLATRESVMYRMAPELLRPHRRLLAHLPRHQAVSVGLIVPTDLYEYLLLSQLRTHCGGTVRIESLADWRVPDLRLPVGFRPDLVLRLRSLADPLPGPGPVVPGLILDPVASESYLFPSSAERGWDLFRVR